MEPLEQAFLNEMMQGMETAKREYGYNATYFLRMLAEYGAVRTAKLLLANGDGHIGLIRLWEIDRLDLTMKAMVADSKYRLLFTREERSEAARRLEKLGCKRNSR